MTILNTSATSSKSVKSVGLTAAAKLAASSIAYYDEIRPLTVAEFDLARLMVKRLRAARAVVDGVFGEGASLAPADFAQSNTWVASEETYAFAQANRHAPNSLGRFAWSMLNHAEIDLARLIEALVADGDKGTAFDGACLTLEGQRFTIEFPGENGDARPMVIVEDVEEMELAGVN